MPSRARAATARSVWLRCATGSSTDNPTIPKIGESGAASIPP
jgi:hypothetical protein